MAKAAVSVSELNTIIKALLESEPLLAGLSVRGELSNYKIYPSGHHYFTLKDAESSLRCVMFKGSAAKLRFRPESGMGVVASGRVEVYKRDGAYQLIVSSLMPEGAGDLQVAYEQLKAKLQAEGLFDREHKKPLPRYPRRIALVTSSAGAAVHDMLRVLNKRWPLAEVKLLPVRVQGAEAPPEIAGAIAYCNRWQVADLIITGRGGGSIEDLWAFNDERVARAIYNSDIPVISAVGHEPDVTISDYAADLRAATPSNAAELAVPDESELREYLASASARLMQAQRKALSDRRARLEYLSSRRVMTDAGAYVENRQLELDRARERFAAAFERGVSARGRRFAALASSLDALSPLKVLGRGYAIATLPTGEILKSASQAEPGERVRLTLGRGALICRVQEKLEDNTHER